MPWHLAGTTDDGRDAPGCRTLGRLDPVSQCVEPRQYLSVIETKFSGGQNRPDGTLPSRD
jgi:hypothetical protein